MARPTIATDYQVLVQIAMVRISQPRKSIAQIYRELPDNLKAMHKEQCEDSAIHRLCRKLRENPEEYRAAAQASLREREQNERAAIGESYMMLRQQFLRGAKQLEQALEPTRRVMQSSAMSES